MNLRKQDLPLLKIALPIYNLFQECLLSLLVLRVLHSLIQALVNVILVRFSVFMIASGVLVVLALRAAMAVFQV